MINITTESTRIAPIGKLLLASIIVVAITPTFATTKPHTIHHAKKHRIVGRTAKHHIIRRSIVNL